MKVLKIESFYKMNNIVKTNNLLTKPVLTSKIDMFCKSPVIKESVMSKFINLREDFSEKLYPIVVDCEKKCWDFYINSTDVNLKLYTEIQEKYEELWKDENLYNEFLNIKKSELNNHEQKQLKNILDNFEDYLSSGEDLKQLRDKENEIAQKYNSNILKIDGKETTKTEINKILETEKNPELRKKAYFANIQGGDLIAEDLKNLVIKRNNYAKNKGYSNYFEYKLKDSYEVDLKDLEILLEDIYLKSQNIIKEIQKNNKEDLAKEFGIKKEDLKSYHYGLLTDNNPEKKVNEFIKTKEQIYELAKKTYQGMGYDIEKMQEDGNLTLDLYPRKNKNTHGFCFGIDQEADARILANLTNNTSSLETLNHELGHCVYTLGTVKSLPFFDREQYPAMTEAVAMMMQDLQKRENILKEFIPKEILDEYKNNHIKDEVNFICKALTIINFEKEMYKNPEQDLAKLWHDMKVKYQNRNESEDIDNSWATIPHYLSHPAYYQNYFRATIIKAQIYNYLKSQLGDITENTKTSFYLKEKLFQYGISMEENELIEKMTGKKLSVDDYMKSLKKKKVNMDNLKIGFVYPKNIVEKTKSNIYSNNLPDYYLESESFYTKDGKKITQTINESKDKFIKTITVQKYDKNKKYNLSKEFRSIQTIEKDNTFTLTRTIDNIIVNGYEFKPYEKIYANKYAKGIKGFIQKIVWYIANDKNGCERYFVRNFTKKVIK